ncbi:MAG: Fic family protein, partial [Clostridiales bacterium]|nr:Fic family protein [Clostridiales bacterium]
EAWQTAIGLQAVDGLKTSAYLLDTAKEHIEGKISIDEAQKRIQSYYEQRTDRTEVENDTKEADIVSARIAKLLGEKAFQFSPAEWLTIHRRLFDGVFSHAGQIRQYNITKREWVLKGDTVTYAAWNSIKDTLDYDFATEKQYSYAGLSVEQCVKHLAKFASDIWQIHPFCEGNTRATAVFMIKYMKTFGFKVNNDAFEKNSWYFRNALVRANYNDLQNGIHATTKFLEMFFSNLILGTEYELKNRYMHVDYVDDNFQSVIPKVPKSQFDTLECTLEELAVLKLIYKNPSIKQKELVAETGKSLSTVKRIMESLQKKDYIRRVDGKRYGKWEVLI